MLHNSHGRRPLRNSLFLARNEQFIRPIQVRLGEVRDFVIVLTDEAFIVVRKMSSLAIPSHHHGRFNGRKRWRCRVLLGIGEQHFPRFLLENGRLVVLGKVGKKEKDGVTVLVLRQHGCRFLDDGSPGGYFIVGGLFEEGEQRIGTSGGRKTRQTQQGRGSRTARQLPGERGERGERIGQGSGIEQQRKEGFLEAFSTPDPRASSL